MEMLYQYKLFGVGIPLKGEGEVCHRRLKTTDRFSHEELPKFAPTN
jgi:hypothetical protein